MFNNEKYKFFFKPYKFSKQYEPQNLSLVAQWLVS